jgi:hypothetical protein
MCVLSVYKQQAQQVFVNVDRAAKSCGNTVQRICTLRKHHELHSRRDTYQQLVLAVLQLLLPLYLLLVLVLIRST